MRNRLRLAMLFAGGLLFAHPVPVATQPGSVAAAVPTAVKAAQQARLYGVASWYGEERQGEAMANGQPFDRLKLTAASWSIPLGTRIRVVNVANGKSVVVIVTDRGPAHNLHRILDLSQAAAEQLGYANRGLALVYYTCV